MTRYTTMIENAYYLVSPPEHVVEPRKERPVMHQYIRLVIIINNVIIIILTLSVFSSSGK